MWVDFSGNAKPFAEWCAHYRGLIARWLDQRGDWRNKTEEYAYGSKERKRSDCHKNGQTQYFSESKVALTVERTAR